MITAQAHILYGLPLRLLNRRAVFVMAGMGTLFSSARRRHRLMRPFVKSLYRFLYSGCNSRVLVQNSDDQVYVTTVLRAREATVIPGCGGDPETFPFFERLAENRRKIILIQPELS